ncbi:MAG: DUF1800 domain-containing protein [Actinobacteria bacterium]|nr:DUF1800 domain-containing protein [Actinomycetota bacterium]
MGRHALRRGPGAQQVLTPGAGPVPDDRTLPAQHSPSPRRPEPETAPGRTPLRSDEDVSPWPPGADAPVRHSTTGAGPGRRGVVAALGSVAALGAGALAVGPSGAGDVVRGVAGSLGLGLDDAAPTAAARIADTGSTAPLAVGTAPSSTKPAVEYQGSTGGKAPTMTTVAAVTQKPTMLVLDPALHVARRATWGPTPTTVAAIKKAGPKAWIESQLAPSKITDTRVDALLAKLDTLNKTPAQLKAMNKAREKEDYFYAHTQLETAAVIRAAWSKRQLFEVMVDFWHSRLHVPAHFDKSRDTLNHYDRLVIRKHALGTFEAMLWAMVTHPAMILYLDNQQNTKFGGNQNLGRELLELHTLGVDAGYTQTDVQNAAKLLTGLSVNPDTLTMVFRPEQHFVGKVKVFGTTYANATAAGGLTTLRSLVKKLANHPKTAEYLAADLVRRFVSDAPPRALVARLAKTYLANATSIKPVLRQLFASPEFQASVGQKYRRPLESTVATMRALSLQPSTNTTELMTSLRNLRWGLDQMGQAPLGHTAPDGYADFAQPWLSTVGTLSRWNMQMALAGGWNKGFTKPNAAGWIGDAVTYGVAVDRIAKRVLFQKPTAAQKAAILAFLGHTSTTKIPAWAKTGNGDYNLRVRAVALLLGAPQHQLR